MFSFRVSVLHSAYVTCSERLASSFSRATSDESRVCSLRLGWHNIFSMLILLSVQRWFPTLSGRPKSRQQDVWMHQLAKAQGGLDDVRRDWEAVVVG